MNIPTLAALAALVLACGAAPASAQTLQVVTESTPYSYLVDGHLAGPATEIVEATMRRAGFSDYRMTLYPWARAYDAARREPDTLIYLIARTPPREALFKWVGEFMRIDYHLYKLKDRRDIVVKRLDDARGYTIGTTRDDVRHQYLAAKGFGKLVVSAQNLDNFRKLVSRQIQLIPLPDSDAAMLCRETAFDCNQLEKVLTLDELSTGVYLAASTATADATVERLRAGFETLRADGTVRKLMVGSKP